MGHPAPVMSTKQQCGALPGLTPFGISPGLALVQAQAALESIKSFWLRAGIPGFPGTAVASIRGRVALFDTVITSEMSLCKTK